MSGQGGMSFDATWVCLPLRELCSLCLLQSAVVLAGQLMKNYFLGCNTTRHLSTACHAARVLKHVCTWEVSAPRHVKRGVEGQSEWTVSAMPVPPLNLEASVV